MGALSVLPCGAVTLGLAILFGWALNVDMRTGSGYGLAILSSLFLACTIALVIFVIIVDHLQKQPLPPHTYSASSLLVFYFLPAVCAVALTILGAAIVAGKAGHWWWIVGILVAELVPVLLAAPPHPSLMNNIDNALRQVGFLGMLIAPAATILVYSITRIRHPVASAAARVPAPPR